MQRAPGDRVPSDCRLALVRDADGGKVAATQASRGQSARNDVLRALPNFVGIVLYMPGLRQDLRVLQLLAGDGAARAVPDDEASAGGALVDGAHEIHWVHAGADRAELIDGRCDAGDRIHV